MGCVHCLVRCLVQANMLLPILLLSIVFRLNDAVADTKSSPKQGFEDLEAIVERLVETRMQGEREKQAMEMKELEAKMEAKDKEMEARLAELEDRLKEKREREWEASDSKLGMEVEEGSLRKESASNISNEAQTNSSLRDLPIVLISAWQPNWIQSPQTVTFDSFLSNFNNQDRPGGGSGVLDLDSGIFTCFTPGYYTVSFSAYGNVGASGYHYQQLYLFKNGIELPESFWALYADADPDALNSNIGVTGSRIVILHMDAGDTLELRMTEGNAINQISLNIVLTGLGFDYIV